MDHIGLYDFKLVILSVVVAALASYTALDLAARIRTTADWMRYAWLLAAAVAMGGGIWSMHFIAMLAFSLPGMMVSYDFGLTLLSLILPIAVTAFGFIVAIQPGTRWVGLLLSGIVMGLGIAGMHYTGMAAMRMDAQLQYEWQWVAASIVIAVGASTVALWLSQQKTSPLQRIWAAIVMGLAVSGMHYTGMQGAVFTNMGPMDAAMHSDVYQLPLAPWIAGTTIVILILGLVAAMYDRHLFLRTAQESQALRQIFETSHLYQGLTAPDGTLTYINGIALEAINARLEDVVNRPIWETPWFNGTPGMSQAIKTAVLNAAVGNTVNFAIKLNLPIGERSFEFSMRPVKGADGKIVALVPEAVDITARLNAEQALHQSLKMEAIGSLTGGIAHDFNNLLMAVSGNLELLRKKLPADDPRGLRLLDNAVEGAKRGAALTQRMLSFARQQDLKPTPVYFPDMVREMSDLITHSVGSTILIETRFPLGLPRVMGDTNQLELALLNLCINARDAMPDGGTLTIGAREELSCPEEGMPHDRYVCLWVRDTGTGMDADTLKRAQEPFFTTKGLGKGTGLGLSMVHGLAAQLQGRLILKSQLGEGTSAEIWLPATDVQAVVSAPESTQPPVPAFNALAILAVDDDALVLENTVAMLEDLGHRVVATHSAREALGILQAGNMFDLLVTDHAMPGMTGVQLAERVARERPEMRILLITGYADLPAVEQSNLSRLGKPFNGTALTKAIEAVMAHEIQDRGSVIVFRRS